MSNKCIHQYVAGPKKSELCGRFIRGKGTDLCYQHQKKEDIKPKDEVKEPIKEVEKVKEIEEVNIKRTPKVLPKLFKKKAVKLVSSSSESAEEPIRKKLPIKELKKDDSVEELRCSLSSDGSSFSISSDSSSSFSISD